MKAWFLSLTLRERSMVQSAALVAFVLLFYLLIWEPVADSYQKNKKNVAVATETLQWMNAASKEVAQLRGGGPLSDAPQGKQFILGTIDRSARKAGLSSVMKRVQPEGDVGVRVWFENVVFDELITWLSTIESQHGLVVNEINIEETESSGLVNVRLFLDS